MNLNAEYYYTDFSKQVVVDMDTDPHAVLFYNLHGRSYSQVVQVEASYPFFPVSPLPQLTVGRMPKRITTES